MFKQEDFIMLPVPLNMFTAVCALIGGTTRLVVASDAADEYGNVIVEATGKAQSVVSSTVAPTEEITTSTATTASPSDVDAGEPVLDAHGHPWSELLHATTKGTTKDGLWRMKPGVTRPAAMPGFPIEEATSTTTAGEETQPAASVSTEAAQTSETSTDEDDEFAAFRAADAATAKVEEEAVASIPARKWTDADLGKLCNQAAVKLGDPVPVKDIIQQFTPAGEVAHSRNIPEEAREDFAKAVEAKAGIEFAG